MPEERFEDFELLHGLDAGAIAALRDIAEPMQVAAGTPIMREGDEATHVYVLATGRASICSTIGGDPHRVVRFAALGPGMGFGERALIDGGPRTADVVADEDSLVYAFAIDDVRALASRRPES